MIDFIIIKTVGQYLPEEKKIMTVENFEVLCTRMETKQSYVVRKMKIKYSGKVALRIIIVWWHFFLLSQMLFDRCL